MNNNLGKLDRILRFILAFWFIGPLAPEFSSGGLNIIIAIIGWIALIESFWGYCWLHKLFGIDNKNQ